METGDGGSRVSLRRRLLARKSPRVACSLDASDARGGRVPPDHLFSAPSSSVCLSDSEASPGPGPSVRTPAGGKPSLRKASNNINKTSIRPTSMIEGNSAMDAERSRRSPLNKYVTALKGQHSMAKMRSDLDCEQSHSDNEVDIKYMNGNGKLKSNGRMMSSSMSAMRRSVDKSSLESVENISLQNSDSNIAKEYKSNTPRSGSTDSLARNTLLAAKVLRLIPTQKARERNFLHGRLASNSLLGAAELERVFPNREVEIFVGTWNMNGQTPPSELNDFLFPNGIKNVPDILAIGIQEAMPEKTEWEICIQEALGPSHILFHSTSLGTLHLCIFLRRDLIWFCSLPEDSNISVRPGTAFRTKGAVAIAFAMFGTSFLFVTAHLTAHQEKVKERVSDIKKIIRALDLPKTLPLKHKKNKDVTCNFDVVMWCGDLNFRLTEEREVIMRGLADSLNDRSSNDSKISKISSTILQADQLSAVMSAETTLKGFQEAPICFPPTYKYDPGTQTFDTSSKQRVPAYTDRILYKTRNVNSASGAMSSLRRSSSLASSEPVSTVRCLAYDSVPTICSSDHKPVWALFTASLRPGTDIIPLAAGLFNREVYLEGIKRRAALLDHPPGTSAVCSIQ